MGKGRPRDTTNYTLEYELICQNRACPLGEVINGRYQAWWDDVGHPDGKRTTEARALVEMDLGSDIVAHLSTCTGPIEVVELRNGDNNDAR